MTTLVSIILGKIIFYYMYDLVKKGLNYFSGKPNYKEPVKEVLDSISNNKKIIDDISKMIEPQRGIDNSTADKIVKMGYIQTQIVKLTDSKNSNLDKTELENQIKTILFKSWNDLSGNAIEKVKKDLK